MGQLFHRIESLRAAVSYSRLLATVLQHQLSSILAKKSGDVLQIDGDATVFEAITLMVEANVGSLLVTEEGEIVGIMTERDYLRRVTLQGRTDKETAGARHHVFTGLRGDARDADRRVHGADDRPPSRHVPVVDEGKVVGVVSIGDLVKYTSKQQELNQVLNGLRHWALGRGGPSGCQSSTRLPSGSVNHRTAPYSWSSTFRRRPRPQRVAGRAWHRDRRR